MKTKGLDITRLVMSILAIVWAIILGWIVFDYFYTMIKGDDISTVFLIFLLPIFLILGAMLIINAIMGIMGVIKYFKNKNLLLSNRNTSIGRIVLKIIVAILGVSPPLLIAYICDIVEASKKKKLN